MPTKLIILALVFSLFFISQVSSDSEKNEETSRFSQALHFFSRKGDRNLMNNMVPDTSKFSNERVLSPALTLGPAPSPSPVQLDCTGLCKNRCSLHSRQNTCMRACGTCCVRCKCVPPGTFGNRELCGKCYTGMTTHGNKPKCP